MHSCARIQPGTRGKKLCVGEKIIRADQKIGKKIREKITVPKIVAQCRKPTHSTQHYLNTLPKTLHTLIHRGEDPSRLSDAITYLKTLGSSTPLAVLLAYILLRVHILIKVFVHEIFFEINSQCRKLSHSAQKILFQILLH